MTASLHITPSRATSSNGLNLDGAKWYFYQTGTTTPQSVYTTAALSTPHSNPVEADAAGKFPNIFFDASLSYRGVLKTADDVTTIYDIDPINTDTLSQLAASGGSALVTFLQAGTGAVARTAQAKMREVVSDDDFTLGISQAITAVRNNDDASFSGAVFLAPGITDPASTISLSASFDRVQGFGQSATYRQNSATTDIFTASGASFVLSDFKDFRTYGGRDVFKATTVGEIASLNFHDLGMVQFAGDAFSFTGGLTSCKFMGLYLDSSIGDRAVYTAGGINNDNLIFACDFTNLTDSAVKSVNLTQGWHIRNVRVEGGGVNGKAVYDFAGAIGNHIVGGWLEGHHEYLLKLSGSSSDGVVLDRLLDIGAKDGVGFKASLFDVGTNRVILGNNYFYNATTAPANCFIYGVNTNLRTASSQVTTREHTTSKQTTSAKRSFASAPSLTFDLIQAVRASGANTTDNLQAVAVRVRVVLVCHDGGGNAKRALFEYRVLIEAYGNTMAAYIDALTPLGNLAGITCTVQQKAGATATALTVEAVLAGVNTGLPNCAQIDYDIINMSSNETDRITVTLA